MIKFSIFIEQLDVAPTFGELHLAAQKSHNNNQQISI
jgi:hypothetical protein